MSRRYISHRRKRLSQEKVEQLYRNYLKKFQTYLRKLEQFERRNGRVENVRRVPLTLYEILRIPNDNHQTVSVDFSPSISVPSISSTSSPKRNWIEELKDVDFNSPSVLSSLSLSSPKEDLSEELKDVDLSVSPVSEMPYDKAEEARDLEIYNKIFPIDRKRKIYQDLNDEE